MQDLREDFNKYVAHGPPLESSAIFSSKQDIDWIISLLPDKPKTIALLFASSIHGWKLADWRARCIGSTHTITLF